MNKFKFSILMANYNNGKFIRNAIESVIAQTYKKWELIIVDDASTDSSLEVISGFLRDKRIKLYKHKKNLGCGASKKLCADKASGDIYGELDPDDALAENALESMADIYAADSDYGFVYSDLYKCDENLNIIGRLDWVGDYDRFVSNLIEPRTAAFRTFKKSDYINTEGYNPELKSAVDKDIIYKLEEVSNLKYIEKPLYYYRFHKKGIASMGRKSEQARIFEYRAKHSAYWRRLNTALPNYTKKEISEIMYEGLLRSLVYSPDQTVWFFKKAFKLNPNIFLVLKVIFKKIKSKINK